MESMNHSLRSVFIISFLLFAFISNGIAQKIPSKNVRECFDYTINIYPEYSHQVSKENLEVDLHYNRLNPIEGTETAMAEDTIRLELVFLLRQHNSTKAPFRVSGVGESRNFRGYFSAPRFSNITGPTVIDIIREAIRDGYKQFRDYLGAQSCAMRPLVSTISTIDKDKIQILLGTSDHVRVGDVFSIYPGEYYEQYRTVGGFVPYLATGTVIEIDDNISMLEIDADEIGAVQVGDIVELVSGSSRQEQESASQVNILQIGRIPPHIFVHFVSHRYRGSNYYGNERIAREEITPYIRKLLVEEAPYFDFRIFTH